MSGNLTIKQEITLAIQDYQTSPVKLENFVDSVGYATTLSNLVEASSNELSHFWQELDRQSGGDAVVNETKHFINRLSTPSKGMLLTSSLLNDHKSLYVPLRASIDADIKGLYSEDLYSLTEGEFAPLALSEMTTRAARSLKELSHFNTSLQTISASIKPGGDLEVIKRGIAESTWVEDSPTAGQKLMSLVNAAPERIEVGELKKSPLKRYLAAGLKLVALASVVSAVGMAGLWGASLAHKSETIGYVDLNDRPTIETVINKDTVSTRKIMEYGEFDGAEMAKFYLKEEAITPIKRTLASFSARDNDGYSLLVNKGVLSEDQDLCFVKYTGNAPVSSSGDFYVIKDSTPTIEDKNLYDFFVKSHEGIHCFFRIDNGFSDWPKSTQGLYNTSLNEVAGDLGAVIDYMRVHGNLDLYNDYLRPLRISNVGDSGHRTAWAMDVIIKQLDPVAIQKKSAEEVPEMVKYLMEKNFLAPDGSYVPGPLRANGSMRLELPPAAKALWRDVAASMDFNFPEPTALKSEMKAEVAASVSTQIARYKGVAPPEVIQLALDNYQAKMEKFDLDPLHVVKAEKAGIAAPTESMLNAFM